MKFIEIKEGLSISIEKIEAIEVINSLSCKIYTTTGVGYKASFPYKALISILENEDTKAKKTYENINKYLSVATVQTI